MPTALSRHGTNPAFVSVEPTAGLLIEDADTVKPRLRIEVVPVPTEDAHRALEGCLNVLADALAERLIAKARAAVAAELGVGEDGIDREASRAAREAGLTHGLTGFGETS